MSTTVDDRPVCTVESINSKSISTKSVTDSRIPCRASDPDLWFAETPADLERAKQLCESCPLQRACLAAAIERAEPWGVWGGQIFDQGVVIARKRPRGRPRKNAA